MSFIKNALDAVEDLRAMTLKLESYIKAMENADQKASGAQGASAGHGGAARGASEKKVTIEMVRSVLAEKSRSGKQAKVKSLLVKYGGERLTDIDPACYGELLLDARAL